MADRAVLVCTIHKGVFFGYTALDDTSLIAIVEQEKPLALKRARMAPYWSVETKSVIGLASIGPQKGSRISPAAPLLVVESLTAVAVCSEQAIEAWEQGPWAS